MRSLRWLMSPITSIAGVVCAVLAGLLVLLALAGYGVATLLLALCGAHRSAR